MNLWRARSLLVATLLSLLSLPNGALAQGSATGLDTNGITFDIDPKTGTLTTLTEESFANFSLGGTTRTRDTFHYVVSPAGSQENAIYTVDLKTKTVGHVDLDRSDAVRALLTQGKKLFGIFYDGNAGTSGIYRIDPATGVTSLVLDLSELDVEPIAGAITQVGKFFYALVKPETDSGRRQILKFKLKAGSASLVDVVDAQGAPVLCDKFKPAKSEKSFVCLAQAASETQVNVCKVQLNGRAKVLNVLPSVERVGSGHTMMTADRKSFYAFVYAPNEPNNQHFVKFTPKGVVKSDVPLSTISIGAHFKSELPPVRKKR